MLVSDVSSPISWAPDGRRFAFLRTQVSQRSRPNSSWLRPTGGRSAELASGAPAEPWISLVAPWRPSFAPAWSPDGKLIAVAAAILIGGGRVILVNSETGATHGLSVPSGTTERPQWLDSQSLVINYPAQLGSPIQLFRLPYPAGALSRLTNDPNDYVGVSVSGDGRTGDVAARCAHGRVARRWRSGQRELTSSGAPHQHRAPRLVRRTAALREHRRRPAGHPAPHTGPGRTGRAPARRGRARRHQRWSHRRFRLVVNRQHPRSMEGGRERPPDCEIGSLGHGLAVGRDAGRSVGDLRLDRGRHRFDLDGVHRWRTRRRSSSTAPARRCRRTARRWRSPTAGTGLASAIFRVAQAQRTIGRAPFRRPLGVDAGRPQRRLRERREHLGPAAWRRRASSAHAIHG